MTHQYGGMSAGELRARNAALKEAILTVNALRVRAVDSRAAQAFMQAEHALRALARPSEQRGEKK